MKKFDANKINIFIDKLGTKYEFAFMSYGIDIRIRVKGCRSSNIWDFIIQNNKIIRRDNIWFSDEFENYINRLIEIRMFM
jgi:hypothetical protein